MRKTAEFQLEKLERYEPLRQLAPGLWVVDGEWEETAFKRRMTVVKLKTGDLAIHSAIRMCDEDMQALDRLGRVKFILVPNAFHDSDAGFYRRRYPAAEIFAPAASVPKFGKQGLLARAFKEWPDFLNGDLECLPIEGTRVGETAFFHHASETLILCDLAFNMSASDFKNGMELKFMRWNQVVDRFGPSRLFRWLFTSDRAAVAKSVARVGQKNFSRIIVSHGKIVESRDAKKMFGEAFGVLR